MGLRHCLYHNLIADEGDANIYCNSNKQAKKVKKGENLDMGPSPNSTLFLRNARDKTIPGLATSLIHSGRKQGRKPSSVPTPSFCQENPNQSTPNQCRDCSWDLAEPQEAVKQRGRWVLENRRGTRRWVQGCPPGCRTSSGCYLPAPCQLSCCKEGNSGAQSCSSGPPCAHSKRGVLSRAGSSLPPCQHQDPLLLLPLEQSGRVRSCTSFRV